MSDGQGGNAPETFDDLASFLVDNPDADSDPDIEEQADPSGEPLADNLPETDEEAPADDEPDEGESEEAEKQPSGLKFKVPVKGEDGAESTIEVDEKELIAGYQRHSDYTRKTQALGDREREITQVVTQRLEQGQNHYLQQAQVALAAVERLAGLRSPQEMFALSRTDPQAWAEETERANLVRATISEIKSGIAQETQQTEEQRLEQEKLQASRAWGVLGQQGIDKTKLLQIYETVHKKYGVPVERFGNITDPALVLIMRDAAAYQGLKDKKASVTAKAKEAPKLPVQRQSVPKNEQRARTLNTKFSSGKAKLKDLAAWIEMN